MFKLINALAEMVELSEGWYDKISGLEYSTEGNQITEKMVSNWQIGIEMDLQVQVERIQNMLAEMELRLKRQAE